MELSGLWSSYTGRDNLPPHCTESAEEGGEGTCPKPDGSGVEMELQPPHSVGGADSPHGPGAACPAACMPRAAATLVLEPFSTSCHARCLLAHNGILFLLLLWYLLYIVAAPQRLL